MGEIDLATSVIVLLAMVLGPSGAAWVGVKVGLNGLRSSVRQLREDNSRDHAELWRGIEAVRGDVTGLRERVARIEGPSR